MKASSIRKGVLFVVVAAVFGLGCELIVDFDRTKIPVEVVEAGAFDAAALGDADLTPTGDANVPETSTPADGGSDTGIADASDAG